MIARDAPIGFETDRLLSPHSITRGTVGITSAGVGVFGLLRYDPSRRRVEFAPISGSTFASTEYQLIVRETILAWDGAPLGTPLVISFETSDQAYVQPPPPDSPRLSVDVVPLLARRCATAGCHASTDAVLNLDLSSAAAIRRTAIHVLASELAASGDVATRSDPQWGELARVDPGITPGFGLPGYSYLVYKIIGDGPIVGDRMPPPPLAPLTNDEISLVSDWIARGAPDD